MVDLLVSNSSNKLFFTLKLGLKKTANQNEVNCTKHSTSVGFLESVLLQLARGVPIEYRFLKAMAKLANSPLKGLSRLNRVTWDKWSL